MLFLSTLHDFVSPQPTTAPQDTRTEGTDTGSDDINKRTAPPESTFKKLRPQKSRYSLLRDEL